MIQFSKDAEQLVQQEIMDHLESHAKYSGETGVDINAHAYLWLIEEVVRLRKRIRSLEGISHALANVPGASGPLTMGEPFLSVNGKPIHDLPDDLQKPEVRRMECYICGQGFVDEIRGGESLRRAGKGDIVVTPGGLVCEKCYAES